jgi:hypothetical protein
MRQFLKLRKTAGSLFVDAEELEKARLSIAVALCCGTCVM